MMIRGLRHLSCLLVALTLACARMSVAAPLADLELQAILRDAPTAKDYPRDSAVWLLREMEITVAPGGATVVREHKLLKLLTNQAQSLANWEIPYDKASEKLEVKTARTLLNGQVFPVEPGQSVESALYPGLAWYDSLLVRPHIYVKGGDYNPENLPEYPTVKSYGGKIVFCPLLGGRSTSKMIDACRDKGE